MTSRRSAIALLFTERPALVNGTAWTQRARTSMCAVAIALALASAGCATTAGGERDVAQADPLEPFNRGVFAANRVVDRAVVAPVAKAWRAVLPEAVRDRVRAFVDNLHEPLVFVNDLLQGRGEAAGITGRRFVINSTLGIGGLFDRATGMGEVRQSGDFGQTLYAWGVADGPYLVLPLFGPSNFRDAIGLGVDSYASPTGNIGSDATRRQVGTGVAAADGIDLRSRNIETLEAIEATSLDFYAYLRSAARQNRQATLREAKEGGTVGDDLVDPGSSDPAAGPAVPPSAPSFGGTPPPTGPLPQSPQSR